MVWGSLPGWTREIQYWLEQVRASRVQPWRFPRTMERVKEGLDAKDLGKPEVGMWVPGKFARETGFAGESGEAGCQWERPVRDGLCCGRDRVAWWRAPRMCGDRSGVVYVAISGHSRPRCQRGCSGRIIRTWACTLEKSVYEWTWPLAYVLGPCKHLVSLAQGEDFVEE